MMRSAVLPSARAFLKARMCLSGLSYAVTAVLRTSRDRRAFSDLVAETKAQADIIREQAEALAHYKKILDRSSAQAKIGVWECDLGSETLTWTDGAYDLFELPPGAPVTRAEVLRCYDAESLKRLEAIRTKAIEDRTGFELEALIRTAKGNERWIRITANVECDGDRPVRIFGMKQDITAEKMLRDRLRLLADRDLLTGLANRSLLQERLVDAPDRNGVQAPVGALLLLDLDGFKQVNDTFGHSAGDACLKEVAARLSQVCRKDELVARMGGDEFALVMRGPTTREAAERILTELRRPISWAAYAFQLSASIGIALAQGVAAGDSSQLFIEADLALYAAKGDGKNVARMFTADMRVKADARFNTIRGVAAALDDDKLELFYQPKVHLADSRLVGFEALLRWHLDDGGVKSAADFDAVFDDPQLSQRLGEWVVATALRQAGDWHRDGFAFGHVAINLNGVQFRDAGFADRLIGQIIEHGLRPDMIQVEVTEGVFLNPDAGLVMTTLNRLRSSGIRIALDDFGTGYASLVHLRTYPIDIIKIDKSFIRHFLTSHQDRAILEATLKLGWDLGIDIVAEGIEKKQHLEFLRLLGCGYGQGYLFAGALPASEAVGWKRSRSDGALKVA